MLINTFLDTEDFVHLYYPEDEPAATAQGCGAGARMASKYPPRPPSPEYSQVPSASASAPASEMSERERCRAPPPPEPPPAPLRPRAADLYPRLRTHYDEPGLDVPFSPICGEFVQWVGRMADGGIIAMSNYRVHAQPRRRNGPGTSVPIRLIDALEIRDLLHLVLLCKNGRQLKCSFSSGEQCMEWWRRVSGALSPLGSVQETFAATYAAWARDLPAADPHRALLHASANDQRHWFGPELERLGFTSKGAWRVTTANEKYELCPSYPPLLVVPASICDEDLDAVARFRAMRRLPVATWRHCASGAVIARSSQPEVGWLGWRSAEDERLLHAFVSACSADRGLQHSSANKQTKLLIVDARSYASAVTNRARGGGCECQQYYPHADIQFMCMPNIHHVRRSFQQLRALAAEGSDQPNWHSNLERTLWLQQVSGLARAAGTVCRAVTSGRPVLVHCSDGWDRTPQVVAAAQLLLDPYYRTLHGFRVLIEREWLDYGHKFADRCGHQFGPEDPNERSPIFVQWLDWVHQVARQHPCSFEFNEAYLIKLATHVHSCMFGTFLCNTGRERLAARLPDATAQVWHLLRAPAYRNHLYCPSQQDEVIWPEYSVRATAVWSGLFTAEPAQPLHKHELDETSPLSLPLALPPHPPSPSPTPAQSGDSTRQNNTNGLMTKTRSCDNLLNEGEKRTTQRRCSDPSIAPDVMKLSMVMCEDARRDCRSALTDSCVDALPAIHDAAREQVDGVLPELAESRRSPRDLTSGSSSLERELCPPIHSLIDMSATLVDATPLLPLPAPVLDTSAPPPDTSHTAEVPVNGMRSVDVDTPEEPPVFLCDTYTDVIGMADAAREVGRTRNISITWRSISESSNQSSTGFDIADTPNRLDNSLPNSTPNSMPNSRTNSHESSPLDNHNSTEGDIANHNVVANAVTELNRRVNGMNGTMNGIDEVATKFLEVDLNGGATSSSLSSESEGESNAAPRRGHVRAARGSQLTLCPASPRRPLCCHCCRRASATSGVETSGESGGSGSGCWCGVCDGGGSGAVRCVCGAGGGGAGAGPGGRGDALDGLPPTPDPLQARLHQIILYQRKVVEELSVQLREAREALRQVPPPPSAPAAPPRAPSLRGATAPTSPHPRGAEVGGGGGSGSSSSGSGSGSGSGSASEVEMGEEARGVVWVPDSAAPRCQHCHHHFWLARRRHHCRRCGGIFCGSCSEMSPWGECGAVRVCRRCRALR